MLARDAHIQHGDRHAGHAFGTLDRVFDGAGGGVDVDDHPLAHAGGRGAADAGDVHLAVLIRLADDRADLGGPDVQPDDVLPAQHHRSWDLLYLVARVEVFPHIL